jgi:hypothetical protein
VYVGALDRRFDWPTVAGLARSAPTVRIDIFGPAASRPPSLPANVFLPGPVDYTDLPRTLARYRVGLLPLSDEETNIGRSPMKLYEYLASGLNVLTRRPVRSRPARCKTCTSTSTRNRPMPVIAWRSRTARQETVPPPVVDATTKCTGRAAAWVATMIPRRSHI